MVEDKLPKNRLINIKILKLPAFLFHIALKIIQYFHSYHHYHFQSLIHALDFLQVLLLLQASLKMTSVSCNRAEAHFSPQQCKKLSSLIMSATDLHYLTLLPEQILWGPTSGQVRSSEVLTSCLHAAVKQQEESSFLLVSCNPVFWCATQQQRHSFIATQAFNHIL